MARYSAFAFLFAILLVTSGLCMASGGRSFVDAGPRRQLKNLLGLGINIPGLVNSHTGVGLGSNGVQVGSATNALGLPVLAAANVGLPLNVGANIGK